MPESAKPRVAVIGLGSMGYGMATSLHRAGDRAAAFGSIVRVACRDAVEQELERLRERPDGVGPDAHSSTARARVPACAALRSTAHIGVCSGAGPRRVYAR